MGADGGVCWIPLSDPTKYNRVIELLEPFYEMIEINGDADWQEDVCSEWEDENPIISAPNCLVGRYGTSRNSSLLDLAS